MSDQSDDEPIEAVIQETLDGPEDPTTRREAVELELEDRGRSEEGAEVEVEDVVPAESPAAGVVDDDVADPPEPNEPA
jgi:hypothetical protein